MWLTLGETVVLTHRNHGASPERSGASQRGVCVAGVILYVHCWQRHEEGTFLQHLPPDTSSTSLVMPLGNTTGLGQEGWSSEATHSETTQSLTHTKHEEMVREGQSAIAQLPTASGGPCQAGHQGALETLERNPVKSVGSLKDLRHARPPLLILPSVPHREEVYRTSVGNDKHHTYRLRVTRSSDDNCKGASCVIRMYSMTMSGTRATHVLTKAKSESCLVKAPAMHASESVLVIGELLRTSVQANAERHTRNETREMCSCWG